MEINLFGTGGPNNQEPPVPYKYQESYITCVDKRTMQKVVGTITYDNYRQKPRNIITLLYPNSKVVQIGLKELWDNYSEISRLVLNEIKSKVIQGIFENI